jgi:oligopeptide/dipeptide ABC transporter ATP-binding protein
MTRDRSGSRGSPLLAVEGLTTRFGTVTAVDDVSLTLRAGDTLGVVGESGAGKSALLRSLVDLGDGTVTGDVRWRGDSVPEMSTPRRRRLRGREVGLVFQNARTAFDPRRRLGPQLVEALRAADVADPRERAVGLLREVDLPAPASQLEAYPHELSGGMAGRAMVAMALAGDPDLLLADEPTTGLDVSVQARLLDLLADLVSDRDLALVLVSHDLGVVSEACDRLCVMYAGRIVERGPCGTLLGAPRHPYTRAFLASVPTAGGPPAVPIDGEPPNPRDPPNGCRFHPRCSHAEAGVCDVRQPTPTSFGDGHGATCHAYLTDGPPTVDDGWTRTDARDGVADDAGTAGGVGHGPERSDRRD